MNDHELLELAAKAAGVPKEVVGAAPASYWIESDRSTHLQWNPLTDDGDALRLAVKLMMDVSISKHSCFAVGIDSRSSMKLEQAKGNLAAATRRAIVRAAAEIGKAMEVGR